MAAPNQLATVWWCSQRAYGTTPRFSEEHSTRTAEMSTIGLSEAPAKCSTV